MSDSNNNNEKISPYNPTSDEVILKILQLMNLIDNNSTKNITTTNNNNKNDILFDLGCGDGRLLQKAIQINNTIQCIGIDIDDVYIQRGLTNIHNSNIFQQQQINRIQLRTESIFNCTETTETTDTTDNTNMQINEINDPDAGLLVATTTSNNVTNNSQNNNNNNLSQLTLFNDATCVYIFLLPKAIVQVKVLLDKVIEYRRQQYRMNSKSNKNDQIGQKQQQQQTSSSGLSNNISSSSPRKKYFFQVATYMFQIHGWIPTIVDRSCKANAPIYIYRFYHDEINK